MATQPVEVVSMPIPIEVSPSVKKALDMADRAKSLAVRSIAERSLAAEMGRAIVQLDKEVEQFFKPMKDSAFETHRKICAKEKEVRAPLEEAKKYLSRQIGDFDAEAERERRVEEARLQEQARLAAIREAEETAQNRAIADAIALEAEGDKAGAEAVLNHPVPVEVYTPPVVLERLTPKVAGVSTRKKWKFVIKDESKIPREYLMVDESAIRRVVEALKGKCNIPGVDVYEENAATFRA